MKTTAFGDMRPKGYDEILEAINHLGILADDCMAELSFGEDEGDSDYNGWRAAIVDGEDGEEKFGTLGYEKKEDLIADLKAAGITEIGYDPSEN